jgi:hypothetical protein
MARALLGFLIALAAWTPAEPRPRPERPPQTARPAPPVLDYDYFVRQIQPIFLHKRKGLARCYVCHSQGTNFRLQRLAEGSTSWSDAESRRNFDATKRFAVPGDPLESRLLTMPLVEEAGGIPFHPGGKHWSSKDDPEFKTIAAWIMGAR